MYQPLGLLAFNNTLMIMLLVEKELIVEEVRVQILM
jgi:hypothetical protein